MSAPPTRTSPEVGWSIPVIMLSSVDLPLPERPTMDTNSPGIRRKSMERNASNEPAALEKVLTTRRSSIIGVSVGDSGRVISGFCGGQEKAVGTTGASRGRTPHPPGTGDG